MFYKIISGGYIVDACNGLSCVRWQEKNKIFVSCAEQYAEGFVSSDGKKIFLLPSAPERLGLDRGEPVEIDEETYHELVQELIDKGIIIIDDEDEPEDPDEPVPKSQLLQRVELLEEQNQMLVECILEMSEVVYGG